VKKNTVFVIILAVIFTFSFIACEDDTGDDSGTDSKIPAFTSIEAANDYLLKQTDGLTIDDPIYLPINIDLGDMVSLESGWGQLLSILGSTGKFVSLDLSLCQMDNSTFRSPSDNNGKNRIVSIILPNMATIIIRDTFSGQFANSNQYLALKSITAPSVSGMGNALFRYRTTLESVSFPAATIIGGMTFDECTARSVYIPMVISIQAYAFTVTGTNDLTITMGRIAPQYLGVSIFSFSSVNHKKNITVLVPQGAIGYG
jgi:hypothetical protein